MTSTANEHDHREAIREIAHCIVTREAALRQGPERTVVRILPDMVVALLHEPYTAGELTLIEAGRHEAVLAHLAAS